jgi:ubiquinol-cytochrome c reductase cytochrome c1 subunit
LTEPPVAHPEREFHLHPKDVAFTHEGPFGKYDRQQLQRGFQVYKEVCAACHGLQYVAFRNLEEIGYTEAEVKAIASQWAIEVPTINEQTGEPATRKAIPSDRFPSPYPNEVAARAANNNAAPPDLSLITKARHDGPAYTYSLLTGYRDAAPIGTRKASRFRRNIVRGRTCTSTLISRTSTWRCRSRSWPMARSPMPTALRQPSTRCRWTFPPFSPGRPSPISRNRHRAGIAVLFFLLIATILSYLSYKNIWATVKKRPVHVTGTSVEEQMRRDGKSLH